MSQRWRRFGRLVGGLGVLVAPSLHAQLIVSTGASQSGGLDTRWQASTTGTTWNAASIVTSPPGQWTTGAPGGIWISTSPSGTGGGGTYRIRQQFTLFSGDLLSFNMRCAADNGPAQLFINNVQFSTTACPTIWNWGPVIALTQANFATGLNTLEWRWTGDNTTDGMAVEISSLSYNGGPPNPSVVPEPSTYALMGTGLLGVITLARRRQRV
jgi:hypothetical protein